VTVRVGVVVFPGSNCDRDTMHALALAGADPVELWHERATLDGAAAVVLPGGFAYGDYLRAGVIARFSPVMRAVTAHAAAGGLVLGICNGFQVLAESGLVPGALLRNRGLRFVCREVTVVPTRVDRPFTVALPVPRALRMPVAHGEGCYYADEGTLDALERDGQVLFRYVDGNGAVAGPDDPANPNGSLRGIAGVTNPTGNVAGLMPHPERAAEGILGSDDGMAILRSLVDSAARAARDGGRVAISAPMAISAPAADGGPAGGQPGGPDGDGPRRGRTAPVGEAGA
jgi:phosphoribosylformylglycinamidine synthase I